MKVIDRTKSKWPQLRITGGPHGKNLSVALDEEEMKGVTRVELAFDATDAVKAKIYRIVEAYVEVEGEAEQVTRVNAYTTTANEATDTLERHLVVQGEGEDLRLALLDAIKRLEA